MTTAVSTLPRTPGLVRTDDNGYAGRREVLQDGDWLDIGTVRSLADAVHPVQAKRRGAGRRAR